MATTKTSKSKLSLLVSSTYQPIYQTTNFAGFGKSSTTVFTTDHFSDEVTSVNDGVVDNGTLVVTVNFDSTNATHNLILDAAGTSDAVGGVKTWKLEFSNGVTYILTGHIVDFNFGDLPSNGAIVTATFSVKINTKVKTS